MLFNSIHFLFFLPVVIGLYYLLPQRFRWILLFLASCAFYMDFFPPYILILFSIILLDYFCGILIERNEGKKRKLYLLISILGNIGLLSYFKYYNFFADSWNHFADSIHYWRHFRIRDIILPIGLSFHTFQSLSYTVEVYRKKQKAERHIGYFANYVLFFPQMVAGPIERYDRLGNQLHQPHSFRYENISAGFRLVLYGLFVKMCVADNLAPIVNSVYDHPEKYGPLSVITALVAFSFQIYADFYGYSTVAMGAARMMGIQLMDNFRQPYFAVNIREFWQRWHISLSTWFRDYVFIPLGGSRVKTFRFFINIMIVFTVSGFWHGANYTFLIWGALHGLMYLLEYPFSKITAVAKLMENEFVRTLARLKTFVLVTLIWVFFRAEDLTKARAVFHSLFHSPAGNAETLSVSSWILLPLGLFVLIELLITQKRIDSWLSARPLAFRWSFYFAVMMCVVLFSGIKSYPFIYFRF